MCGYEKDGIPYIYDCDEINDFVDSGKFQDFLDSKIDSLSDCITDYKYDEYEPDVPMGVENVFETAQDYIDDIDEALAEGLTGNGSILTLLQYGITCGMQHEVGETLTNNLNGIAKVIFYDYFSNCYIDDDDSEKVEDYLSLSRYWGDVTENSSLNDIEEEIRDFIERMEDELDIKVFDLKKEATETIERIKNGVKDSETYVRFASLGFEDKLSDINESLDDRRWVF